ncbi:MAG: hypothetical protein IK026_01485 [Eubacteriaceae bacterium]|nr:hypothetical protein [Eubacteriaceae bacterium]
MAITAKENYLRMLKGEIPDHVPSNAFEDMNGRFNEELLTPASAPDGPIVTKLGVTYVGSAELNNGAMPAPGKNLLGEDISNWRDVIHIPDMSGFDWEKYYTDKIKDIDRTTKCLTVGGGDYFLTLVSFMGFENLLLNMYENPDEIMEMLEYVSQYYMLVLKQSVYYVKPDIISIMDDDAGDKAPFFSAEMYKKFFKPYHKKHTDIAKEIGAPVARHDCGLCECFIPDWVDIGINSWNPAQVQNDLVGIKKRFGNKIAIAGGWDNGKYDRFTDMDEYRAALENYVDTFAPGGGFVYSAMTGFTNQDEFTQQRRDMIKDVYFNYAYNWYKTH